MAQSIRVNVGGGQTIETSITNDSMTPFEAAQLAVFGRIANDIGVIAEMLTDIDMLMRLNAQNQNR